MNSCEVQLIAQHAYQMLYRQPPHHCEVRETLYGFVVFTLGSKGNVVVKFSKQIGVLYQEAQQLQTLKRHLGAIIPDVLFFGAENGLDYLMMEWRQGHSAHTLTGTEKQQMRFADDYTDLLLALHEIHHEQGFECQSEQFTPSLTKAFEAWYQDSYRFVTHDVSHLSESLKRKYHYLWQNRTEIFAPIENEPSSLVHNACHLGNVLFDPQTYCVSGLVDPTQSGFKHREWDHAQLNTVRPDLYLQEWYEKKHTLTNGYHKRGVYLQLWQAATDLHQIGWHDPNHLSNLWDRFHQLN